MSGTESDSGRNLSRGQIFDFMKPKNLSFAWLHRVVRAQSHIFIQFRQHLVFDTRVSGDHVIQFAIRLLDLSATIRGQVPDHLVQIWTETIGRTAALAYCFQYPSKCFTDKIIDVAFCGADSLGTHLRCREMSRPQHCERIS